MRSIVNILMTILSFGWFSFPVHANERPGNLAEDINPGSLEIVQMGGEKPSTKLEMPLQHTDVKIEVSGFVASATVTQHYQNPFDKPIEAVYTFPLPDDAAVNDMQMTIGQRTIKGIIKRKEEAKDIYEQAKRQGQRASLLEQERPNIFTQAVANIMPGDNIVITIQYVNILHYSEGSYELIFPMVVGPRYIPGEVAMGKSGTGWSPDTNVVPDASRITPPVLKPGERTGHDMALAIDLEAGVAIHQLHSTSHVIDINEVNPHHHTIKLHPADTIPNKDFILRYEVAAQTPTMATIAHHQDGRGFFTLMIQPQKTVTDTQVVPRELIFIVDTSGSMQGFPIEKSKEAMRRLIQGMRSTDIFNVVRFAGDTGILWEKPQPYTSEYAAEALRYIERFSGRGGTEMQKGILEALAQPASESRLRIAFLLTDGYVGDEPRILAAIEKARRGARVFSLGVGSSVNRYLLNRAAEIGRGEAFYVRQDEDSSPVIDKFFQRVDRPSLAYIEIDWGKLDVYELYPSKIPDLWAGQPIQIHGRYTQGGEDTITVRGQLGTQPYEQKLSVQLPQNQPEHEAMATIWARQKVHELMNQMVRDGQTPELIEQITQLGLSFRLMTQWTSFVAVEEKVVNIEGKSQTVVQPVELPEGVSYEGIFGEDEEAQDTLAGSLSNRMNMGAIRGLRGIRNGAPAAMPEGILMLPQSVVESEPMKEEAKVSTPQLGGALPIELHSTPEKSQADKKATKPLYIITFEAGKATLTEASQAILAKLAAEICQNIAQIDKIMLAGHTDNSAADDHKQKLSLERAVVVADYLISQCPVLTRDKLILKGLADQRPIASNETEAGRSQNRRVEVFIISRLN
ncbi:MAG: VWA domain-containing protein [Thioploca sp.]|nr:VWA domain-containing protein [Thioploca sp.]